jgi:hypothetical protein
MLRAQVKKLLNYLKLLFGAAKVNGVIIAVVNHIFLHGGIITAREVVAAPI